MKNYFVILFVTAVLLIGCSIGTSEREPVQQDESGGFNRAITLKGIRKVECGAYHSFVLLWNGDLYATGSNGYGQLGLPSSVEQVHEWKKVFSDVRDIEAGSGFSFAITRDGNAYVAGNNSRGQLGGFDKNIYYWKQATNNGDVTAVACGGGHSLILKDNGSLYVVGNNKHGQLGLGDSIISEYRTWTRSATGVKKIAAGAYHS